MTYKSIISVLAAQLLLTCAASCSIKEDRTVCPCWLDIWVDSTFVMEHHSSPLYFTAFNQLNEQIQFSGGGIYDISNPLVREQLAANDWIYEDLIRKGNLDICCVSGINVSKLDGKVLYYQNEPGAVPPVYAASDSLYVHCSRNLNCTGEFGTDSLIFLPQEHRNLHKEFAAVKLRILGQDGEVYPYLPVIKTDALGMDITRQGSVLTGDFSPVVPDIEDDATPFKASYIYMPEYQSDGIYYFNLPRHTDLCSNIRIELFRQGVSDPLSASSFITGRFIGDLINALEDFSWTATDLGDIYIEIDFSKLDVIIHVLPWDVEQLPDIVI